MNDGSEFTAFVAALPPAHETNLMADNVSTAFFRARRAGWTLDQLIGDAQMSLVRGGVGLVVTRLGSLAMSSPTKRAESAGPKPKHVQALPLPECKSCGIPYARTLVVNEGTMCRSCGEPLALTVHTTRWSR